jgi:TaqI-like C-terminal specificity domain
MRYGPWLAQPREIGMFTRPRILLREITASLSYCLYSCFTQDHYLNNKSILNILHPDDCIEALKVLTCTLNSRLMSIFYKEFAVKGARQISPKVVIKNLREFPFPRKLDKRSIARLSTLHDRTVDLYKQLAASRTSYEKIALTRQIEELIERSIRWSTGCMDSMTIKSNFWKLRTKLLERGRIQQLS